MRLSVDVMLFVWWWVWSFVFDQQAVELMRVLDQWFVDYDSHYDDPYWDCVS